MAATQKTKKKPARPTDRRNIWLLIITTLLVLGSVFMFTPPQEKINQGLDIQGGLSVVLTARPCRTTTWRRAAPSSRAA